MESAPSLAFPTIMREGSETNGPFHPGCSPSPPVPDLTEALAESPTINDSKGDSRMRNGFTRDDVVELIYLSQEHPKDEVGDSDSLAPLPGDSSDTYVLEDYSDAKMAHEYPSSVALKLGMQSASEHANIFDGPNDKEEASLHIDVDENSPKTNAIATGTSPKAHVDDTSLKAGDYGSTQLHDIVIVQGLDSARPVQPTIRNGVGEKLGSPEYDVFFGAIEDVLRGTRQIAKHMSDYGKYIAYEDAKAKPLYEWTQYTEYGLIVQTIQNVNLASRQLEKIDAEHKLVDFFPAVSSRIVKTVIKNSINTSNVAQSSLGVLNRKMEASFEEVNRSSMSESAKDKAKTDITNLVNCALKHTTAPTESIYRALDLLLKIFYQTGPNGLDPTTEWEHLKSQVQCQKHAKPRPCGWAWKPLITAMIIAILITIVPNVPHSADIVGLFRDTRAMKGHMGNVSGTFSKALKQAVEANHISNSIAHAKQNDLNVRLKNIEEMYEANGLRIDAIWESLGAPNENGTYSLGKDTCQLNEGLEQKVQQLHKAIQANFETFNKEMVQLRKHVHRVDLRLTKGIEQLKK